MNSTSKAGGTFVATRVTATEASVRLSEPTKSIPAVVARATEGARRRGGGSSVAVESAVYGHIRAMRALGVTAISTDQVAKSLSLPRSVVDSAVSRMRERGVKVARL